MIRSFFATCTLGAEPYLAAELTRLGAPQVVQERLGVSFRSDMETAFKMCLWTRLASRIVMPVAEVNASTAEELYQGVRAIEWEQHLSSLNTFAITGVGSNKELRHSGFLALKVKDGLVDRVRAKIGRRPNVAKDDPDVHIIARLNQDKVTISMDLSGDSLHMRGWRMSGGIAPLKEHLAALMIEVSGYDGMTRLLDPMCGSGTILIEAAERALGLAPGRTRSFGFERWPTVSKVDRRNFLAAKKNASEPKRKTLPRIVGWDIDNEQINRARQNIGASGLGRHIRLEKRDATTATLPGDAVQLITNVPYGERMDNGQLLELYTKLGERWRVLENAVITVLCPGTEFRRAVGLAPDFSMELHNGPLDVMLYRYVVGSTFTGFRKRSEA
jgi:23S rRNA G2445 N2-methylase RlmL